MSDTSKPQADPSSPSPAGSATEILEWIESETLCGMVMLPRTTEDGVWNAAHRRVLGIIRNYRKGEGLFQMTRAQSPNAPALPPGDKGAP